jgi:Highly conserved protein containing a thioredoxin domain
LEGEAMSNRLKDEKSPYLLQHKDNPVEWYPWCGEAFTKAKKEDKPIFLSIGYSTCHWCHVMAHESFEDAGVAELLNQGFVCIKVDREERPDIDAVYMSVCQAVTGQGGWPLTIIMTPKQKPFFAGTYFPKERYYGRPGLVDILSEVLVLWKDRREDLMKDGEEITALINNQCTLREKPLKDGLSEKDIFHKAYHIFVKQFDPVWGGFGGAPKFPSPHNLLFLMRYAQAQHEPEALRMAEITLNAMADGGIHDHIGGGFSRYSTDEQWLVPHFEKMLYDNALLLLAYTDAYQITGKEKYRDVALHTADYILRELTDWQGGFYCGQDADSEGVEGKYYVFTQDEVISVLGEDEGKEFCRQYGITKEGNFEGKSIPNRLHQEQTEDVLKGTANSNKVREEQAAAENCLDRLYQYRISRTSLHKDDKILLSWNAWTILALARAGAVLREKRYLEAAKRAQEFIEERMNGKDGRLYLRFRDGEAAHQGMLEDYGVYALALLELYRADFRVEYLSNAIHRAKQMLQFFEDDQAGGYFINAADAEQLIARPKEMYDGAIPSGNSVAFMVLQRLAALTGEVSWQEAARRQMAYCVRQIQEYPAGLSFALLAMTEAVCPHRELVCAVNGEVSEEMRRQLERLPRYGIELLVKTKENADALTECAPFTSEYPLPKEGVLYYLCEDGACQAPVRELNFI